jgi:hypothetical protein
MEKTQMPDLQAQIDEINNRLMAVAQLRPDRTITVTYTPDEARLVGFSDQLVMAITNRVLGPTGWSKHYDAANQTLTVRLAESERTVPIERTSSTKIGLLGLVTQATVKALAEFGIGSQAWLGLIWYPRDDGSEGVEFLPLEEPWGEFDDAPLSLGYNGRGVGAPRLPVAEAAIEDIAPRKPKDQDESDDDLRLRLFATYRLDHDLDTAECNDLSALQYVSAGAEAKKKLAGQALLVAIRRDLEVRCSQHRWALPLKQAEGFSEDISGLFPWWDGSLVDLTALTPDQLQELIAERS